jgi:hypothetical protein
VWNSKLSANELGPGLSGEGLGALDGGTDGAIDDELGKHTERSGDTEQDGVEVLLLEAVVLEAHLSGRRRWGRGSWSCRAR